MFEIPQKKLRNGFSCPTFGLGTWLMGGDNKRIESPQDTLDIQLIKDAVSHGIAHIDTAEIYGDNHTEELIGKALKDLQRDTVFLASKAQKGHHTQDLLIKALDNSLRRLKTDYLDLYYLHRYTPETPLEESAAALNIALKQGKIKNVGVCNFSISHVNELQKHLDTKIFANQVHYNLAFREPELSGLISHAEHNDYFVIAWRPLRLRKRNDDTPCISHNAWETGAFPILDDMAQKYNCSNVQIAISWVTHHPNVLTLVKSSHIDRLLEAAQGTRVKLSEPDYLYLSRNFKPQHQKSDTISLE